MSRSCFAVVFLAIFLRQVSSWANNLTLTPVMGWANWNTFGCNYTEATIKQQSQALVDLGLKELGYSMVLIQECIGINRTAQGILIPDPGKFPSGLPALVEYIHSLDLRAGIYTDVGPQTCAEYVGSFGFEERDAKTFIDDWKFDFIEEDNCFHVATNRTEFEDYTVMHNAIMTASRPCIFYIACQGDPNVQTWGKNIANLWRTGHDIHTPGTNTSWDRMLLSFHRNAQFAAGNGPGHWNDADMMVVGVPGLTLEENRSHFSLWAISATSLWIGCDLTRTDNATINILKNSEIIEVNQDAWGYGPIMLDGLHDTGNNDTEVWWKVLKPNEDKQESLANAVLLLNLNETYPQQMFLEFAEIGMNGNASVRDLWSHKDLGSMSMIKVTVSPHGVVMLRVSQ